VKARGPAINPLQKLDKKSKVRGIIPINLWSFWTKIFGVRNSNYYKI
jgi:hypothetical protein